MDANVLGSTTKVIEPQLVTMNPVERARWFALDSGALTPIGIDPKFQLDRSAISQLALYIGTLQDVGLWSVGDMLVWGEQQAARELNIGDGPKNRQYFERRHIYWQAILDRCKLDITDTTAYNIYAAARAWPWDRRRHDEHLSFEHHRLLASREPEEQDYWLDMAVAGNWTVRQLRHHLYSKEDPMLPNNRQRRPAIWDDTRISLAVNKLSSEGMNEVSVTRLIHQIRDEYEGAIR